MRNCKASQRDQAPCNKRGWCYAALLIQLFLKCHSGRSRSVLLSWEYVRAATSFLSVFSMFDSLLSAWLAYLDPAVNNCMQSRPKTMEQSPKSKGGSLLAQNIEKENEQSTNIMYFRKQLCLGNIMTLELFRFCKKCNR